MNTAPGIRYGGVAISLHWLIAALIFGGWALGVYMTGLKLSPEKLKLYSWHKWIGITVLTLAFLRALWRATHAPPPANPDHPRWQRRAAAAMHATLYLMMFALPLSGWTFSSASGYPVVYLGLVQIPDLVSKNKELAQQLQAVHETLAFLLLVLVAVHVAAALQHHWMHRDDTLSRMLPFLRRKGVRS